MTIVDELTRFLSFLNSRKWSTVVGVVGHVLVLLSGGLLEGILRARGGVTKHVCETVVEKDIGILVVNASEAGGRVDARLAFTVAVVKARTVLTRHAGLQEADGRRGAPAFLLVKLDATKH